MMWLSSNLNQAPLVGLHNNYYYLLYFTLLSLLHLQKLHQQLEKKTGRCPNNIIDIQPPKIITKIVIIIIL